MAPANQSNQVPVHRPTKKIDFRTRQIHYLPSGRHFHYFTQMDWSRPPQPTFDLIYELRVCPELSRKVFSHLSGKQLRECASVSKFWFRTVNSCKKNSDKIRAYNQAIPGRIEDMVADPSLPGAGVFSSPVRPDYTQHPNSLSSFSATSQPGNFIQTRSRTRLLQSLSPIVNRNSDLLLPQTSTSTNDYETPNAYANIQNQTGKTCLNINKNNSSHLPASPKSHFQQTLLMNLNRDEKSTQCLNCGWACRLNINSKIATCQRPLCKYAFCASCYAEIRKGQDRCQTASCHQQFVLPGGDHQRGQLDVNMNDSKAHRGLPFLVNTGSAAIPQPLFASPLFHENSNGNSPSQPRSFTPSSNLSSRTSPTSTCSQHSDVLMHEIEGTVPLGGEELCFAEEEDVNMNVLKNLSKCVRNSKRRSAKKRLSNL